MTEPFQFLDPGTLVDEELALVIAKRISAKDSDWNVPAYGFDIFVGGQLAGDVNFRPQISPALEMAGGHMGYEVYEKFRGCGYAGKACSLLIPFIKAHALSLLWMSCNPDNTASRRTLEKLGAQLVETVNLPPEHFMYKTGEVQKCRYRLVL